ncbi:septation protein IspZ [Phenylobacterium sp. LjRoot164]|uniref:inner membrane-spanning protein YciB n=1 Tax=unclassified Phenylobacterium TaxID=2640670 RepID=UPI003ECCAD9E
MSPLVYAARPILIDMAATLVFYVFLAASGDVALATGVGIALGVAQVAVMKLRGRKIAAMQWTALALVVIMGGATLITHDARFVLFKATIVYAAIGAAMLECGWMGRYMPPIAQGRIPESYINGAGYVWAGLMFVSGLLNLGMTLLADPKLTASVMSLWAPGSKLALFAAQYLLFRSVARRNTAVSV